MSRCVDVKTTREPIIEGKKSIGHRRAWQLPTAANLTTATYRNVNALVAGPQASIAIEQAIPAFTMLARHAPVTSKLTAAATRALPAASAATRLSTASTPGRTQKRTLATVQDPPARTYGGLKDQDRIFQNLYSHHGADIKSAMKYGDWYKTKEILLKGHDWVRVAHFSTRAISDEIDHF